MAARAREAPRSPRGASLAAWLPPVAVFVAVIALWEGSFLALGVQSFLIPRPSLIWTALISEWMLQKM